MNATTAQDVWYLARDGKQHGPLSDLEMTKLVEFGHLRVADLVWRPGFTDWRPAPSVFPTAAEPGPQPAGPASPGPAAQPAATSPVTQGSLAPAPAARFGAEAAAAEPAAKAETPAAMTAASGLGSAPAPSSADAEARALRPMTFDTRDKHPFIPASQSSQFGTPVYKGEPQHELRSTEADDVPPGRGPGRGVAVPLLLLVLIGGVSTAGYLYRDTIKATVAGLSSTTPDGTTAAAPTSPTDGPADSAASTLSATPVTTAAVDPVAPQPAAGPPITGDASAIDAGLQKSPLWTLLKTEFPDWYAERVREVGQLAGANTAEPEINTKLVEAVVALRRQNAEKALAASPARLQDIASAFITNLSALQSQSVDACYGFISKGETTPAAAALVQNPVEGAALHAQLQAVFAAVVEGRRAPATRNQPQKTDYDLLATELGTIGWSQADIQLFADPKTLSEAPRDRVCKMVRDWFSAHLAVKDAGARERLLFETLRPVVAG